MTKKEVLSCRWPAAEVPPLSDEVKAILEERSIDFETSGLKFLTNEARVSLWLLDFACMPR